MIPQEVQTLSALLSGHTGLIGSFPDIRPRRIAFMFEDGTPLRLLGFNSCHSSIVQGLGQKGVAGFGMRKGKKRISADEWRKLTESANAVLFTRKGRGYEVEVLKRVDSKTPLNGILTVCFKRTGKTDEFIPCG